MTTALPRQAAAELLGSILLTGVVIGSGILASSLAAGNDAVALVITAGYWWTASTSFANPAISIARAMSDTFAGVRPADVPGFIAGQIAGALLAWAASVALLPKDRQT